MTELPNKALLKHGYDKVRSFAKKNEVEVRRSKLLLPHIEPLTRYVEELRQRNPNIFYPYFDPADGGVEARILFLFEKPGPKTAEPIGSGFISRDNNDATAASTFKFMEDAGIPRHETVTWNVIPGWNMTIDIVPGELESGLRELENLLSILKKIETVVLVGRKAQRAKDELAKKYKVFESYHPSDRVKNSRRQDWDAISAQWKAAYQSLS